MFMLPYKYKYNILKRILVTGTLIWNNIALNIYSTTSRRLGTCITVKNILLGEILLIYENFIILFVRYIPNSISLNF